MTGLHQAAMAFRNSALEEALQQTKLQNERQSRWLRTRAEQAAPQALTVPI